MKRGWFGGGLWKPKNVHSLEHLRYLYSVLSKNQVVQESNRSLLVESLRSIAEILIWGDQNDSSVFDFFLEKNMLSFFLKIMKQKCGSYVCVQLLQTLNILFENIRNETSLYYLLSNNHVNSIIIHKFDFSDEEVMAYYISFLKTLSFKLNSHTIHFFYHERTNDFPLYTEAIKFFHHPETMVRIAVRTLTLNVFRVEDESMLNFIRDRTAAPYFSNLVWFIGNHILELDACVRNDVDHNNKDRLADLVAEHLDHLHYLNDILELNITELNYVLADHLLNRLLVPLLVYSLCYQTNSEERPRVSRVVALFLLSQVFLIFSFSPLMRLLAQIILHADHTIFEGGADSSLGPIKLKPRFVAPEKSLEQSLPPSRSYSDLGTDGGSEESTSGHSKKGKGKKNLKNRDSPPDRTDLNRGNSEEAPVDDVTTVYSDTQELVGDGVTQLNITDEEKENLIFSDICRFIRVNPEKNTSLVNRPFLQCIMSSLNCSENDYMALLSLCLLYALGHNPGLNKDLLSFSLTIQVSGPSESRRPSLPLYNSHLVDLLLRMVSLSAQYESKIRVVTLELALVVLKHQISLSDRSTSEAVKESNNGGLKDPHLAALEGAKEEATLLLRNFYKGEEIFLDMFEDEWRELHGRVLKVQFLLQDSSVLLPPTRTPLTGVDFDKRLPCGEVERARRAMRVFFLIREFCLDIKSERDTDLPLTNPAACVQVSDVLDLNNSDLIACVVIPREGQRTRRFLVIDVIQVILVEPDQRKMGWGVAKFVGFLQDLEVLGDKDDSRVLHVTIHRPSSSSLRSPATLGRPAPPLLAAKFVFDDHIRCMAAKQRLTKGRLKARQKKLHLIARLLELPNHLQPCPSPPSHALRTMRQEAQRKGSSRMAVGTDSRGRSLFHKSKFSHQSKGPGVALKTDTESVKDFAENIYKNEAQGSSRSKSAQAGSRSLSRPRNQPEDIPMDYLSKEGNDETKKSLKNKSMDKSRVASTDGNSKNTLVDLPMSSFSFCSVPEQVPFGRTSSSYISNRMPVLDSFPIPCPNFQASIQPSNKMSSEIGVAEKEEIAVLKDDYSSKTSTAETSFDSNSLEK